MSKSTGFEKVKFWEKKEMRKIAIELKSLVVERATVDGKDKDGKKLPAYTNEYKKRLRQDMRSKKGNRPTLLKNLSLSTSGSKVSKRQFELRGFTMGTKLFKAHEVSTIGFLLSWFGEAAAIIQGNAKKGRNMKGLTPKELTFLADRKLSLAVDKQLKKIPNHQVLGKRR